MNSEFAANQNHSATIDNVLCVLGKICSKSDAPSKKYKSSQGNNTLWFVSNLIIYLSGCSLFLFDFGVIIYD